MKLTLYHYRGCPFCHRVWDAADRLGVHLEERNTIENPEYRQELYSVMGRGTVPVLHIEHPDGRIEWLPESRDIVRFLETHFG